MGVERRDLTHRRDEARSRGEERRAVVGVIDHLKLLIECAAIGQRILDPEGRCAWLGGDFRPELQLRPVERPLVDASAHTDTGTGLAVDEHLDFGRGNIRDFSVQRQVHLRLFADVVDERVPTGMARPFQPAPREPLVEAFQPSQPAARVQVHVLRVHDLAHGRVPAEAQVTHDHAQDAHPARRYERNRQPSVVDGDEIDAVLPARRSVAASGPTRTSPGRCPCLSR